jgi:hypothetical protein
MGLLVLNLLLNDLHLLEAKINIICTFYISFLPDPCYLVRGYHCEVGFFFSPDSKVVHQDWGDG